jgi:hypothetical protein
VEQIISLMKVEQVGEEVWLVRNKRRGLRLKVRTALESGTCTECYLYRLNYGKCLRTVSSSWVCDDSLIFTRAYGDQVSRR